jgi:filamentous hemagglutinin family protein
MKAVVLAATVSLLNLVSIDAAIAQVATDGTLSTRVTVNGNTFVIEEGDRAGTNLFHSFREFSIPTGGSVFFNNAADVQNIFSRVTGTNLSNIDGLIRANGNANLFLLNPNGILFGANAQLNIGGSFMGTTASSIRFADGAQFSATNPTATPLLTVSTPVGLRFGNNPNPISHQATGFQVLPNQAIALIAGHISIPGGTLTAPSGNIVLGSVAANSQVRFNPTTFEMNYADATGFRDIDLSQGARVDTSGDGGGSIQVQARRLRLSQGAQLRANTLGAENGADITIRASERINIVGAEDLSPYRVYIGTEDFAESGLSGIYATVAATATGDGGNIQMDSPVLKVSRAGAIVSETNGAGNAGHLTIQGQRIEVVGNPNGNGFPSTLDASTLGAGRGGDVTINADRFIAREFSAIISDAGTFEGNSETGNAGNVTLNVRQLQASGGTQISSSSFSSGNAGRMTVNATESVELVGFNTWDEGIFSTGLFTSVEPEATGSGGDLIITTGQLRVLSGGRVSARAGKGNAGNIVIRAREVEVAETVLDFTGSISGIAASVDEMASGAGGRLDIVTDRLRVVRGGQITAATEGDGNAGNINIQAGMIEVSGTSADGKFRSGITASSTTDARAGSINLVSDRLTVQDNAILTVSNTDSGDAGNLNIRTRYLFLNQDATLRAEVNGGSQGNIQLQVGELLQLRDGSRIVTSATGASTGGNITIHSPVIAGAENSDIIANAVQGNGGNINITTEGIFGLTFRPQLTANNDITASSQLGVSGTVQVNALTINPVSTLRALPTEVVDASQQIAQTCDAAQTSQFVVTGRGGLPENPTQAIGSGSIIEHRPWSDLRDLNLSTNTEQSVIPSMSTLTEAAALQINENGQLELVSVGATHQMNAQATCSENRL